MDIGKAWTSEVADCQLSMVTKLDQALLNWKPNPLSYFLRAESMLIYFGYDAVSKA
jgi:hypothetical protein